MKDWEQCLRDSLQMAECARKKIHRYVYARYIQRIQTKQGNHFL